MSSAPATPPSPPPPAAGTGVVVGADGLPRCPWPGALPDYVRYHDEEWGRPVHGDVALFEKLSLEAFQSGLSWLTILRKREGFRDAFDGFVPELVAAYDDADAARLMADDRIVRNRAKVEATIANARVLRDWRAEHGEGVLDALVWSMAPPSRPRPITTADVTPTTVESTALARALKARGLRFVGPTTAYALMQAVGVVDDHLDGCHVPAARSRDGREPRRGRA